MYAIYVTSLRKLYELNTICIFSSYKREFSISFFKRLCYNKKNWAENGYFFLLVYNLKGWIS